LFFLAQASVFLGDEMSPSGRYDGPVKPAKHPKDGREIPPLAAAPLGEASVKRKTKETDIELSLSLSGGEISLDLDTLGFFGHMLNTLATYSGFGLSLTVEADNYVDDHHYVEDVGLVLGEAIALALGDYSWHARFASVQVPMDDALAEVALDIGRRPYLFFEANWPQVDTGGFELCLVEEFLRALSQKAGLTLHVMGRHATNSHHLCEAIFKALGLALARAMAPRGKEGPFSTKGIL
jgi:imidazoleglycerol-phosphate dehydratase